MFSQCDDTAHEIMREFEDFLVILELRYSISFKDPRHDMAGRFLNKIKEFKRIGD